MKTIVTGYDGTDESERALTWSAELAERFDARVIVLTVGNSTVAAAPEPVSETLDPQLLPAGPVIPLPPKVMPPRPEPEPDATTLRTFEQARGRLAPRGIEAEYVPAMGDPAEALLQAAEEHDADLLVVGSREHGFFERLLGECVDEKLARKSPRDLLLVH